MQQNDIQSAHLLDIKTDTASNYYNDAKGPSIELIPQNCSKKTQSCTTLKQSVASTERVSNETAEDRRSSDDTSNNSIDVTIYPGTQNDSRNINSKITKKVDKILCQHCGIAFENSWLLNVHHNDINYCKCCNLTFVSKGERATHVNKEHPEYFLCPCGKIFEDTDSKRVHKKHCTRNYCYKCRIRLDTCDLFEEHVMHNHVSVSECPFCEQKLGAVAKTMIHYQLHTTINPVLK